MAFFRVLLHGSLEGMTVRERRWLILSREVSVGGFHTTRWVEAGDETRACELASAAVEQELAARSAIACAIGVEAVDLVGVEEFEARRPGVGFTFYKGD